MKKSNLWAFIFFIASKVYIISVILNFVIMSYVDPNSGFLVLILLFMYILYPAFSLLTNTISLVIQLFNISKNKKKRYIVMLVFTILSILFAVFMGWLIWEVMKSGA